MTRYEVVEARLHHCGLMVRRLRRMHRSGLALARVDPHRELRMSFAQSVIRRSWLIDGEVAAIGGVVGSLLSGAGFVWLALSETAEHHKIALIREARRQLADIMMTTAMRELVATILLSDPAALRLAVFLGFHIADEGPGAPASRASERRVLAEAARESRDRRLTLGNASLVAMGYHPQERRFCA